MRLARHTNRLICRLLAGAFLFVQLLVAAHACPGMGAIGPQPPAASSAVSAMPADCDQVDRQQAGKLCSEHCKTGQQSADTAPALSLPAAAPALLYALPQPEAAGGARAPATAFAALLAAAPPPPHTILHCVLRI